MTSKLLRGAERRVLYLAFLLASWIGLLASLASAQSPPTYLSTFGGTCKLLAIAGKAQDCKSSNSLVHQVFGNGRANFSLVLLGPSVGLIAFSGDQLLRPTPDELRLLVNRILTIENTIVPVRGECVFKGDSSKAIPQSLRCSTREGGDYRLEFDTDGKLPDIKRF